MAKHIRIRVHALIIGVGAYPHIERSDSSSRFGLSPLTSPCESAIAIANWLRNDLSRATTNAELGSVELLISSPKNKFHDIPTPTMREVSAACLRWNEECINDENSLAFFYFCGHGLYSNSRFLLCDDFGVDDGEELWAKAIDLEGFRAEAIKSGVKRFLGFCDSCASPTFYSDEKLRGRFLLSPKPPFLNSEFDAMYYASTAGRETEGNRDAPSDYAEAILKCLNGVAAVNVSDSWETDTFSMASAIAWLLQQKKLDTGRDYSPTQSVNGNFPIFSYGNGSVCARLEAISEYNESVLDASITLKRSGETLTCGDKESKPFYAIVPPGEWLISIKSRNIVFEASTPIFPPAYSGIKVR
jgi:hypothetical protein